MGGGSPHEDAQLDGMSASRKPRRALRLVGWNAVGLMAGLALIGLVGEAWLRLTVPFKHPYKPTTFVPEVGVLRPPDTEVRWTNGRNLWTVSRTNSLGFLDREPPNPERAAQSCHITFISDSLVEAAEVPIADKLQVRLEALAARQLPHLEVTTSAFGMAGTGQVNQLAFYDQYARRLRPKLVVLVFSPSDYIDNFPLLKALQLGVDPEHPYFTVATRAEDGGFRLRSPDPDHRRFMLPWPAELGDRSPWGALLQRAGHLSHFWWWLRRNYHLLFPQPKVHDQAARVGWVELLSRRPAYAPLIDRVGSASKWKEALLGFFAGPRPEPGGPLFAEGSGSPFFKEALAHTAFALDEFKRRAERDGAALAVLASHRVLQSGRAKLDRLREMAKERNIPVIDQADFIRRQGAELRDAELMRDRHWSPTGHRWVAEAMLEYLQANQDVCLGAASDQRFSAEAAGECQIGELQARS